MQGGGGYHGAKDAGCAPLCLRANQLTRIYTHMCVCIPAVIKKRCAGDGGMNCRGGGGYHGAKDAGCAPLCLRANQLTRIYTHMCVCIPAVIKKKDVLVMEA